MSSERRATAEDGIVPRLLGTFKARGGAPNVAAACARRLANGWLQAVFGEADTFFDLASLTKPMTAVSIAASALLSRRDRLGQLDPEFDGTASAEAPIELLLAHRAGLLGHIPIYEPLVRGRAVDPRAALRLAANARRPDATGPYPDAAFAPVYSDLGYALAGSLLAAKEGTVDAGDALTRLVVRPLGLEQTLGTARALGFAEGLVSEVSIAPTEDVAWRGGLVRGAVHDENAWALTGLGGSGHAGMFGTASAVLTFGQGVLDAFHGQGPFGASNLGWLVAPRPGGDLRAGFDGKSAHGSSAGDAFGPRSFGHLGFTGTSLWIDPDAGIVVVFLSNRVSPTRANDKIRAFRPVVHDALHQHAAALRE